MWLRSHPNEGDSRAAIDRLERHAQFIRRLSAEFTTSTTTTDSEIIPPGYRPLLANNEADRPLFAASTKGDIRDATAFLIPGNVTETAIGTGAATHVEGTQPTEGIRMDGNREVGVTHLRSKLGPAPRAHHSDDS